MIKAMVFLTIFVWGYCLGVRVTKEKLFHVKPSEFYQHGLLTLEEQQRLDNVWAEMKRRMK